MIETRAPLPLGVGGQRRRNIQPSKNGNLGLYYNKFFNQWNGEFSETIKDHHTGQGKDRVDYFNGKMSWLLAQIHVPLGDSEQFTTETPATSGRKIGGSAGDRAASRLAALAKATGGRAEEFVTTGPFVTGMGLSHPVENGFLWHHTLGVPYLPGSSIKGMVRAWVEHWRQEDTTEIDRLFGRDTKHRDGPAAGKLIVFDALPVGQVSLYVEVITPHDGGWRISKKPAENPPADWISPNPIPFLAVSPGATFQFALAPRRGAQDGDLDKAFHCLQEALGWIGAGAKTAVGFGRFEEKRPGQGDRIKIVKSESDERDVGRTGIVLKIVEGEGGARAQIKPDDNLGKLRGNTFPVGNLQEIGKVGADQ